ncbi:universal stress protein [Saccharothrix isguenensis]
MLLPLGWLAGSSAVVLLAAGSSLVGVAMVKRSGSGSTSAREESVVMAGGPLVVGVDGTEASGRAALWAGRRAVVFGRSLVLVYGMGRPVYGHAYLNLQVDVAGEESVRRWAQDMLHAVAERCRAAGADVRTEITAGEPADAVVLGADEAAFVVVGHSDRGGVARLLLGSTAIRLTRPCPCPVVVVRDEAVVPEHGVAGPVVVGVDGSPVSGAAVRFAVDFASRHGAEVLVVRADDRVDAGAEVVETATDAGLGAVVDAELADCARRYPGVRTTVHTSSGAPAEVLLAAGDTAGLLVVGSHGRGAPSSALLGSVSREVVHHAPCPVAVLPPETANSRR